MSYRVLSALLASVLLGTACGGPASDSDAPAVKETPIADSLKQPIDKAQAVEEAAMQRKAEMDEKLAEMEGASDDDPS